MLSKHSQLEDLVVFLFTSISAAYRELVKRMLKEASEQAALDKDGGKWCH